MSKLKFFAVLFISLILIMPVNAAAAAENIKQAVSSTQYSTWLWNTRQIVQDPDGIINFLTANKVNNLYLQVDYDLKIDAYKQFIKKASAKNISIHALDGGGEWVSDNGTAAQQKFFDWVTAYQKSAAANEKFNGVHLDVEPYVNVQYGTNPNKILENYQSFLVNSINKSNALGLKLSIDIPFWFNEVSYKNKYGSGMLADWVMTRVKNITIMAYRDSAKGIINAASAEMKLGQKYGAAVTIAVETQKSSEGNDITFYEEGQTYMKKQLDQVAANYKGNASFSGFAVHHVVSWMSLKK